MSWFQDLAGRAENILTKIDQNAATVLQHRAEENGDVEANQQLLEISIDGGPVVAPKLTTTKPLLLGSKISSKGMTRSVSNPSQERYGDLDPETQSSKSERLAYSGSSSRRSSFNSRKDGTVIEVGIDTPTPGKPGPGAGHDHGYTIERELAATKIILAEVKSERDELKSELDCAVSQLGCGENAARIAELEMLCHTLVDEKNDLSVKLLGTEDANSKYVKSISELESIVAKQRQCEQELNQKLEMAKAETRNALAELQQYRVRAHATLQLKEKMIEQLKEQMAMSSAENDGCDSSNAEQILNIELEQIKNEKGNVQEELNLLSERYKHGESRWATIEEKLRANIQQLERSMSELQHKLGIESNRFQQLDCDYKIRQKELLSAREELVKQRTSFSMRIHEKDAEIKKLKFKAFNRPTSPSTGLEDRLGSLTQSLVQKQSALESVTAERNALRLQLEKLEHQYRSTATQVRQQRAVYLNSNETDDAKSLVPNFMVENPFDTNVARRVKRAYSSLDSIGVRMGIFLRRYPLIRILVIVYIAVLHMWVMFVLLSSTPV